VVALVLLLRLLARPGILFVRSVVRVVHPIYYQFVRRDNVALFVFVGWLLESVVACVNNLTVLVKLLLVSVLYVDYLLGFLSLIVWYGNVSGLRTYFS
jgi:hypothetical protein